MATREDGVCRWQHRMLSAMAVAVLVLVIGNITLFLRNRSGKEQMDDNQRYIDQSLQFSQLNNRIVQSLATLAENRQDGQLKALLNEHGITYTINPPAGSPTPAGEKEREVVR